MFLSTNTENVPLPPWFSSHHLSQCCFQNLTASSTETALVRLTGLCLSLYFDCILATALFLLTDPHRPRAGRPAGGFSVSLFLSPSPTHLLHIHVRALKSLNLKKWGKKRMEKSFRATPCTCRRNVTQKKIWMTVERNIKSALEFMVAVKGSQCFWFVCQVIWLRGSQCWQKLENELSLFLSLHSHSAVAHLRVTCWVQCQSNGLWTQ